MRRRRLAALGGGTTAIAALALVSAAILGAPAANAGTNIGNLEAETMTSVQGYGTTVYNDANASAGKALKVDSNVTVKGTVTSSADADSFWITAHTDSGSGTATMNVIIDGTTIATNAGVALSSWAGYKFDGTWAAGTHTVKIAFTNSCCRNLYLDKANFATSATSTATATPSDPPTSAAPSPSDPPATSTPTDTATSTPTATSDPTVTANPIPASPTDTATPTDPPTTSSPSPTSTAPTETGTIVKTVYTTGYGYWDNTPAGSSTISNPVIHQTDGGTGTWADPVTVAVGHSIINGKDILDYPAGERFYIPNLQKYFIVEDTCGDGSSPQTEPCHQLFGNTTGEYAGQNADPGSTIWIDLWVGGNAQTSASITNACEDKITADHTVIFNPSIQTYKVVTGDISGSTCHTGYGETPQLQ
jgi:uncharacterized protein YdeI (BOF family)